MWIEKIFHGNRTNLAHDCLNLKSFNAIEVQCVWIIPSRKHNWNNEMGKQTGKKVKIKHWFRIYRRNGSLRLFHYIIIFALWLVRVCVCCSRFSCLFRGRWLLIFTTLWLTVELLHCPVRLSKCFEPGKCKPFIWKDWVI